MRDISASSKSCYAYIFFPNGDDFRIIMLALRQYQGGWLHGLQGVGKTETIKELARAVAKQCLVFNCFHGIDTKSIGRILKV